MIAVGARLPSVALPSTLGGAVDVSLCAGRSVVFVYPYTGRPGAPDPPGWDDIPGAHGSTPQARGFGDRAPEFARVGYRIFGISGQDTAWQAEAARRLSLPFALLSDERFAFADALDLPRFSAGGRVYHTRMTLLVADGVVSGLVHPVLDPAGHARSVLERLTKPPSFP